MISRTNALVIAVVLFFCSPLIRMGHAQQAQLETQAVQVIGLAGLKENTKGRLTVSQRNSAVYLCQGQRRRGRCLPSRTLSREKIASELSAERPERWHRSLVLTGPVVRCLCFAKAGHTDDSISRRGRRPARSHLYSATRQGGSHPEGADRAGAHTTTPMQTDSTQDFVHPQRSTSNEIQLSEMGQFCSCW